jgi:luciferase family oxidoreductase group 1
MLKLSVLDLAPVPSGSSAGVALRNSIALAQHTEKLGYHRYWVAEHHNMPGIASSAPAVLIGHLASATHTIRLGSGGVMLPNHAPLTIAEQFGMLEALHPGRIDLGIGRAPGTDQLTASALRRTDDLSADGFPEDFGELIAFFHGTFPPDHPYSRITAVPARGNVPELWLLGSSGYSAQVAGMTGLPFAFAHHFMPANTLPAISLYRRAFRPSAYISEPYVMVAVQVVCADTDEEARHLAAPSALSFLKLRQGRPGQLPTPEEAATYPYTDMEREAIRQRQADQVMGSPETVRRGLLELQERTQADELMLTTVIYDHADRLRSYELVMSAMS